MANGAQPQFDRYAMFEQAKKKAQQETMAGKQQAQEAIQRRFAQLGMQGSGESIKQEQVMEQKSQEQLGERFGAIEAAKQQEQARQADIQEARQFQVGEREAQQKYATGERIAAQSFSDLMLKKQQAFARGERLDSQKYAAEQQKLAQAFTAQQQDKQNEFAKWLDSDESGQSKRWKEQMEFAKQQFEFEKDIQNFNKSMAESEMNKKSWFDQIGTGGTNVWKGITQGKNLPW